MSADRNKQSIRHLYEQLNQGNFDVIDLTMTENFRDFTSHGMTDGIVPHKQAAMGARHAFPDLQFHIEDVIGEGDRVVVRGRLSGTHAGGFMGAAAAQQRIDVNWIAIYRFAGERAAERWLVSDDVAFMRQLGVIG